MAERMVELMVVSLVDKSEAMMAVQLAEYWESKLAGMMAEKMAVKMAVKMVSLMVKK